MRNEICIKVTFESGKASVGTICLRDDLTEINRPRNPHCLALLRILM